MSDVVGSAQVTVTPDLSSFAGDLASALGPALTSAKSDFDGIGTAAVNAGDDIKGIGNSVTSLGDIITGVAIGSLIADGVKAGVSAAIDAVESLASFFPKLGAEIQGAYNTVNTSTTATGETLEGLKDNIDNIARTSPAAFGDIASGVSAVHRQLGLTGPELELTTRRLMTLSRITGTDLQANIKGVTTAFNQFNIKADDQEHALDQLLRVYQNTGIPVTDLEQSLGKVGATAQLQGLSFEQTASFLGLLYKQTGDTASATQAFNKILADSVKSGKDVKTQFRATFDGIKNGTVDLAEGFKIFGPRAAGVFAQIQSGKLDFDQLAASIDEGGKSIAGVAGEVTTWQGQLKILVNNLKVDLGPIAVDIFKHITEMAKLLIPIVQSLTPVFQAIAAAMQPILAAIAPIITELVKVVGAGVVTAIQTLAPAFVLLLQAVAPLVKPVSDLVAAFVIGLAPIISTLVTEGFVPLVRDLLPVLVKLISDPVFLDAILQIAGAFADIALALIDSGLLKAITDLIVQLGLPAIGLFRDAITAIRDVMKGEDFKTGVQTIKNGIQSAFGTNEGEGGKLVDNWRRSFNETMEDFKRGLTDGKEPTTAFSDGLRFLKDEVIDPLFGTIQSLGDWLENIGMWLGNLGEPLGWVVDQFEKLGEVIGTLGEPLGWILEQIENAIGKIGELISKVPDFLKGNNGQGGFSLPGFAEGGIVPGPIGAPVMAIVHGGETIIPPGLLDGLSGGSSQPFMPGAAPGGGATIVIQVAVPPGTSDPHTYGAAVGDAAGAAFVAKTNMKVAVRTSPSSAR